MLKHVVFLLFLYGIEIGGTSSSPPGEQTVESKDIFKNGIKKNEVGANGVEVNLDKITRNFQNPVVEYLLKNSDRASVPPQRGLIREIQHSQNLIVPTFLRSPFSGFLINRLPQFEFQKKPVEESSRNPENTPFDNFWNFLKNKTQLEGGKIQESVVSSPVLHLNKNTGEAKEESTRIQAYPAVAVVINTFKKDGSLKSSVTHFQPDFNSLGPEANEKEVAIRKAESNSKLLFKAILTGEGKNPTKNYKNQYSASNFVKSSQSSFPFPGGNGNFLQGISWPFANYFPIVIHDPFLSFYNAFAMSMYNAVSTMIEYGPEADICKKKTDFHSENVKFNQHQTELNEKKASPFVDPQRKESAIFDEVTMESGSIKKSPSDEKKKSERKRRDTTSIYVKSREGDKIEITLKESNGSKDVNVKSPDERARSFSQVLVNTPPLSTILRPPQQGYADKKRKAKPSKPVKEEGSSEEIGEEHEESTSQSQESGNEAVAISPPPEGASVAEAKPIGLAIAGPGGVAASKPQGTAVAGPGGLAIARPVGTAIAGVEVEGSVPIGGQQKNKKKPKQEQEQTDSELHYVGGLTGPIGNPQPKEFADRVYYKTIKETEGNNIQESLFFHGTPNSNGFQVKLGQQNGKYGLIPMFVNPVEGEARLHKRTDFPIFFHGLLGNGAQGFDQFQNYQTQF